MTSTQTTDTTHVGVAAALAGLPSVRTAFAQFSLQGRVALVTGAQRGIGLELSLALAEAGAVVYCMDLPTTPDADWVKVQEYCAGLPDHPDVGTKGRLEYMHGDVTNQKSMWALAEEIVKTEGRLDVAVANAGIAATAPCLEYEADDFQKVLDVNLNGVLYTAQAAGQQMAKLGIKGSIVLIASMNGSIANPNGQWTAYNTSKSAVLQMARSLACELGEKGIRVNTISPGYTDTAMTRSVSRELFATWASQNPLGRIGRTDELRGAAMWLASDASTFCTGSDIIVDGGHRAW
ncbi:hypothetical protein BDQ12DRAFT_132150 [Crucibulum laeve]|uniref:Sorbose reductase sou1 n=1 Tax=Crucibulum laeve TaxID=68775 RepID=A0A5C3LYD9_9AGAR|nr:hypothetical protein BDQ12DRAFT_132150 [Crucibulum laeve]